MQPNPHGRTAEVDAAHRSADQVPPTCGCPVLGLCVAMSPAATCRRAVLELSRERDSWQRRELAAEERGYARGFQSGFRAGYARSEADSAAAWAAATEPIVHPERGVARRLRAALAGERRDRAEHERRFIAKAWATPAWRRTDPQYGATRLYPPPGTWRRSA